jgi:hypothetical protein
MGRRPPHHGPARGAQGQQYRPVISFDPVATFVIPGPVCHFCFGLYPSDIHGLNSSHSCKFCKQMQGKLPVIRDSLPAHRSRVVAAYVILQKKVLHEKFGANLGAVA